MSEQPPTASRRKSSLAGHIVRRGLPLIVLLLVLAGAYVFWTRSEGAPAPEAAPRPQQPIPVSVVAVQKETVPVRMRFLGQTEGAQRVEIRARVAGYLLPRLFEEGAAVTKGQKLFQIDPRPFEVEVAQAKAGLQSAEASLTRATQQLKRLQVASVSRLELENAQAEERVATAEVSRRKAELAAAELQLGYTSIESPINGRIGQALKDTGSYVDAGQNGLLVVIQQVDPMYVRYSVTEQEILRFERQRSASQIVAPPIDEIELEITLADGSTYPHRGRINFVDVQVDQTTGTSVIRGQVPNPDDVLRPGQFIYATVHGIQRVGVIRVPQGVVSQSPTGASVMVVNDKNQAEVRPIELGDWSGEDHWIVEKGLSPGDRVIADRLMMVRPGVPVTVTGPPPAAGPAPAPASGTPATAEK